MAEYVDIVCSIFLVVVGINVVPTFVLVFCMAWKELGFKGALKEMKYLPDFLLEKDVLSVVLVLLIGIPVLGAFVVWLI